LWGFEDALFRKFLVVCGQDSGRNITAKERARVRDLLRSLSNPVRDRLYARWLGFRDNVFAMFESGFAEA